jgi:hypothetical protein
MKKDQFVDILLKEIVEGKQGRSPIELDITGASSIYQTTQFPSSKTKYHNYYLLVRVESYFGACSHTAEQLDAKIAAELSGLHLTDALNDPRLPVKIAAMDAYLGVIHQHPTSCSRILEIPGGTPVEKAVFRDTFIAEYADIKPSSNVALIGVVNPLIEAIRSHKAVCLPCDLQMKETQWGEKIERDMEKVIDIADNVICTGMTLSNGSFDRILERVIEKSIPLTVYAQTGSAVIAQFVGKGVTALVAEPFPFSQFNANSTQLYCYKQHGGKK